ncbi:hypothetical protein FPV67DRAFT_1414882 [Lyophyllum atratum]|nr:hypothetical protein FPV67DRAFT_1414882 [Lyophyllum atratum]
MTPPTEGAETQPQDSNIPLQYDYGADSASYADLVCTGAVGLVQIYENVFVVQGWDAKNVSGTRSWYHLERTKIGLVVAVACYCKGSRVNGSCVHSLFMEEQGEEEYPGNEQALADSTVPTVLFSRQPIGGERFVNHFSVSSRGETVKSRAVVIHEGDDRGGGSWRCAKDMHDGCVHISDAQAMLRNIMRLDSSNDLQDDTEIHITLPHAAGEKSIIQPVLPPIWAALDTDISHYVRPLPCRQAPLVISLDTDSACPCEATRTFYDPQRPILERQCAIYGLTEAFTGCIQVQPCSTCPGRTRRLIGPDPRNLGIFNFNNRVLFTHELLDDYTSVYTSSETPFTAWVTVMTRRYAGSGSSVPFVSEQIFRAAWFAYADLQDFSNDMRCPKCGPSPEDVIWDGVTVGFHKKHILPTLRPPTVSDQDKSPVRKNRYIGKQQVLIDAKLRRKLRIIVKGAGEFRLPLRSADDSDSEGEGEGGGSKKSETAIKAERERVSSIPEVLRELIAIDASLGVLFNENFGLMAVRAGVVPPKVYKKLFIQVCLAPYCRP